MATPRVLRKLGWLAALLLTVVSYSIPDAARAEFNFARYKETDLDEFLARRRTASGLDVVPALPLKFDVTLASHGRPCEVSTLKRSMRMGGMSRKDIDESQISSCIRVRSAKGQELEVFIQDVVNGFLPDEVAIGDKMSIFVIHVYTVPQGPGLLVNEFLTPRSTARAGKPKDTTMTSCGCWIQDEHPGVDFTADEAGGPAPAMADGVVVKIEEREQAPADLPIIGGCGRYVVLKHTYPNGRIVYTRYARLGRIVGPNGQALVVGARVKAKDAIGEIGPSKVLHFEIRPVAPGTTMANKDWAERYGKMPDMEWSRYDPVDPQKFDAASFGGVSKATK